MYELFQKIKRFLQYGTVGAVVATGALHPAGLDLMKTFEGGCDGPAGAECPAYIDPVGVPTIGFGHTLMTGTKDFDLNDTWTEEFASEQFQRDVQQYWDAVGDAVTVPLNQCQQTVLTSWTYNVGIGAMKSSTLVRLLNQGQYDAVPAQLMRWNKGGGRELRGLTRRRAAEGNLWTTNCGEN